MSLGHGELVIELNGEVYELRPTLKAMKKIQARFGGLRGAMEAAGNLSVDDISAIIAAGCDANPRDIPEIEENVFAHGVALATQPAVEFLTALVNPKGTKAEESQESKPGKKSVA